MRSIKEIERRISVNRMVVGGWYRLITKLGHEYIFKFNGIINRSLGLYDDYYIGRDYSYCLWDGEYGSRQCYSVCDINSVVELWVVSNNIVLKYFDESEL
jgi:hypothetical protein